MQRDEISFKNKEITASIEYAKSLQDAILPNEEYIRKYLPEHFILWLPRDIVSGDFYWFFERDGKIFLAAADCTGHGVPGAFVSMTCHNILNQVVIDQNNDDTGDILSKVHIAVSKVFQREGSLSRANDGMDITLVCIDQNKKKLYYSGALNPLVQISNNSIIQHKVDRFAIGGGTPMDFRFKTNEIELNSGDCFYLFSDGFKDQFGGEHGKKYMNANFVKYLQKIHPQKTDQQRSLLKEELERWVGHYERIDDVLVVGFRVQ